MLPTEYLDQIVGLVNELRKQEDFVHQLANEIVDRCMQGKQVIVFGNGGSAANASHFVCDLSGSAAGEAGLKIKALCLTDNTTLLTAWANDESYEAIFAQQLKVYCNPGDLVIAISCSGNSLNVLRGIEVAKQGGASCFALCGFDGGRLAKLADHAIVISARHIKQIEDIHLVTLHIVSLLVKEKLKSQEAV